jgi:LPXTG-motif cell wall-anchored protein
MKRWGLSLIVIAPLLIFMGMRETTVDSGSFAQTKEITVLRNIGHQILLSNGDDSSRILPVEEFSDGKYVLHFENPFTPIPDSLVSIFARNFDHKTEYSIGVRKCDQNEMVYSFVLSDDTTRVIVPCRERPLPRDCYELVIQVPTGKSSSAYYLAGLGVLVLGTGLAGLAFFKRRKVSGGTAIVDESSAFPIGHFRFYPDQQKLELEGQFTELTGKECHILTILAKSPNAIISRELLQKEVWEDEGVIVTRSLDMFISKLRKKLKPDPAVSIINVHGKGYRLAINEGVD